MSGREKHDNLVRQLGDPSVVGRRERGDGAAEDFGAQREGGEECSMCKRWRWEALVKDTGHKQKQRENGKGFRMLGIGLPGLSGDQLPLGSDFWGAVTSFASLDDF